MPYGGPTSGGNSNSVQNALFNGDMSINQLAAVNAASNPALVASGATIQYANTDMCGYVCNNGLTTGTINDAQVSDHPILGVNGFCKSITVTTAEAAFAAAENFALVCPIEGYLFQPFVGQTSILSFWIKSPKTGIHCVALTNGVDRSYVAEFIVATANTWQQVQVGVTFNYVGGTWNYTNGIGLRVVFPLGAGTGFQTNGFAWVNNPRIATANQQNLMDTIGNTFRITDVQLTQGIVAGAFQRKPFNEALMLAQRYYCQSFPYGTFATVGSNALTYSNSVPSYGDGATLPLQPTDISPFFEFPTTMRLSPSSVVVYNADTPPLSNRVTNLSFRIASMKNIFVPVPSTVGTVTPSGFSIPCSIGAGNNAFDLAIGDEIAFNYTADARLRT